MGNVSPIVEPVRRRIEIPVRDALFDHRFEDRPVFPAVEAMEIMAGAVKGLRPEAVFNQLTQIRFDKFLPVARDAKTISVFCHVTPEESGGIRAELRTRSRLPSGFSRNMTHAAAVFTRDAGAAPAQERGPKTPDGPGFRFSADRLYRELVPFGPAFQTLTGQVALFDGEATATASCPKKRQVPGRLLGNSFILDGAFHAACAWGQRFAGIVAFPVRIDRRRVLIPTRRGERYAVRAVPDRSGSEPLVFTLEIADGEGRLRERVEGVYMRDVSGGRWKPPEWVSA
jgi:hypothetical protein